jgi:hypothetical protein
MKRRVYKRYRTGRVGGQHYIVNKDDKIRLMAQNISDQSDVPLSLAELQATSGVTDIQITMLKNPRSVKDVDKALTERQNFIIGVNKLKRKDRNEIGRDYARELKKVDSLIKEER